MYMSLCPNCGVVGRAYLAVPWIDARQVDLGDELDLWWLIWVLIAAVHLQGVDSVFVDALFRSY